MDETNLLIEDGAIDLQFGATKVRVPALNIESSVQWSKRAKAAWFAQARKNLPVDAEGKPIIETDSSLSALDKIAAFETALDEGAGDDLLMVRDLVREHSSQIITDEVIKQATAQQIVVAFEKLFELENPMRRLRGAMARV